MTGIWEYFAKIREFFPIFEKEPGRPPSLPLLVMRPYFSSRGKMLLVCQVIKRQGQVTIMIGAPKGKSPS